MAGVWKLWKTRQPSALAKGITAIPLPGGKSSHQTHAVSAMTGHPLPVA
jgi:hypothetical protein